MLLNQYVASLGLMVKVYSNACVLWVLPPSQWLCWIRLTMQPRRVPQDDGITSTRMDHGLWSQTAWCLLSFCSVQNCLISIKYTFVQATKVGVLLQYSIVQCCYTLCLYAGALKLTTLQKCYTHKHTHAHTRTLPYSVSTWLLHILFEVWVCVP